MQSLRTSALFPRKDATTPARCSFVRVMCSANMAMCSAGALVHIVSARRHDAFQLACAMRSAVTCHVQGRRCEVVDHTALAPSLVISHEITEDSPLYGLSVEDIRAADGAIFVSVAATDDNHLQVGLDSHYGFWQAVQRLKDMACDRPAKGLWCSCLDEEQERLAHCSKQGESQCCKGMHGDLAPAGC